MGVKLIVTLCSVLFYATSAFAFGDGGFSIDNAAVSGEFTLCCKSNKGVFVEIPYGGDNENKTATDASKECKKKIADGGEFEGHIVNKKDDGSC